MNGTIRTHQYIVNLAVQDGFVRFDIPAAIRGKIVQGRIEQKDTNKNLNGGTINVVANLLDRNDANYDENDFQPIKDRFGSAMTFDGTSVMFEIDGPFAEIGLQGVGMAGAPDFSAILSIQC